MSIVKATPCAQPRHLVLKKYRAIDLVMATLVLLIFILRLVSNSTANISFLALALYALSGRVQAIQALALSWLFTMLNPGIAPEASAATVGRYAVLGGATLSVLLHSSWLTARVSRPVLATLVLGAFIVLHSIFFSPMPDVSFLKAVSWIVAVSTLLSAWGGLAADAKDGLIQQIFGGLLVLLIVSLPLLTLPLGYLRNDNGFQGVLNHPQAFGPTMALLGTWAVSQMLVRTRPSWGLVALVGICLVMVVLSEARTAGLAMVIGLIVAGLAVPILAKRSVRDLLPGLYSHRVHAVLVVSIIGTVIAAPFLAKELGAYFIKRNDAESLAQAYEMSRGVLIYKMWTNIEEKPLFGIGFGIASHPHTMNIERDSLLGLPTSASIEKGVLPLAVLEELGVFGFSCVALWILMIIRRSARGGGMSALAVVMTILFLNLGESTLFSPGGLGLLLIILLTWAASTSKKEWVARSV